MSYSILYIWCLRAMENTMEVSLRLSRQEEEDCDLSPLMLLWRVRRLARLFVQVCTPIPKVAGWEAYRICKGSQDLQSFIAERRQVKEALIST